MFVHLVIYFNMNLFLKFSVIFLTFFCSNLHGQVIDTVFHSRECKVELLNDSISRLVVIDSNYNSLSTFEVDSNKLKVIEFYLGTNSIHYEYHFIFDKKIKLDCSCMQESWFWSKVILENSYDKEGRLVKSIRYNLTYDFTYQQVRSIPFTTTYIDEKGIETIGYFLFDGEKGEYLQFVPKNLNCKHTSKKYKNIIHLEIIGKEGFKLCLKR